MKTLLFMLTTLLMFGCAKTPIALVEDRYSNLEVDREIEEIYRSNTTVIFNSHSIDNKDSKCKEIETIAVSNVNIDNEWRIIKFHNERDCESKTKDKFLEDYKRYKSFKNEE